MSVKVGDFTTQAPPTEGGRFNLILTNPPYVRHHHIDSFAKLRLKEIAEGKFNRPVSGLAGLYVYFVLLAHEWMADDGLAVWLIPSEFMDVNYGAALRDYLTQDVSLIQIHRFAPDEVQFNDALVTSAIVIFRNKKPAIRHEAVFTFGGSLSRPSTKESVPLSVLRQASKWTSFPTRSASGRRTNADAVRLGELFSIKRGLEAVSKLPQGNK